MGSGKGDKPLGKEQIKLKFKKSARKDVFVCFPFVLHGVDFWHFAWGKDTGVWTRPMGEKRATADDEKLL